MGERFSVNGNSGNFCTFQLTSLHLHSSSILHFLSHSPFWTFLSFFPRHLYIIWEVSISGLATVQDQGQGHRDYRLLNVWQGAHKESGQMSFILPLINYSCFLCCPQSLICFSLQTSAQVVKNKLGGHFKDKKKKKKENPLRNQGQWK